jgi:hypothetical protein
MSPSFPKENVRSNCFFFAIILIWWRSRRWFSGRSKHEPYLVFRPSRAGGPFHMFVGTMCPDGKLKLISYKPIADKKPFWGHALFFKGRIVRGDSID